MEKNTLIIANPGTGKTTGLVKKFFELLQQGYTYDDILCITFTNKAVGEIRNKMQALSNDEKNPEYDHYKDFKDSVSKANVHTFHSFALYYLNQNGSDHEILSRNALRYSIFKSLIENKFLTYDKKYLISDIVPKFENSIRYMKSFNITPEFINSKINDIEPHIEDLYKKMKITGVSLKEEKDLLKDLSVVFADYENYKKDTKKIDYNDMLLNFIKEYDPKSLHYKYVLVDELQDVSNIESKIVEMVGDNFFLVGDRKQSIFGFQGGSIVNFNKFKNDERFEKRTIGINYRSGQFILDYSKDYLINNSEDKDYKEELENFKESEHIDSNVKIIESDNDTINDAAVNKALELIKEDGKTAIITRTNSQINSISKILDSRGIDYLTTNKSSNSKAKNDIIDYLGGLFYDDQDHILNALITPFSGISLKEGIELNEILRNNFKITSDIKNKANQFFKVKDNISIKNLDNLFTQIILPISVSIGDDYYFTSSSIMSSIDEYLHMGEPISIDGLFDYLSIIEQDDTDQTINMANSNAKLILITVHKAKGLEFDNVIYLPFNTRYNFKFIDVITYSIVKEKENLDIIEELDEESLRVDFVAFTRAKKNLYIFSKGNVINKYTVNNKYEKENMLIGTNVLQVPKRYDEAYSLFVNKRYEDSKKYLEFNENWIKPIILDYFNNLDKISYSLLSKIKEPYDFLTSYILKLPSIGTESLERGSNVHKIAFDLFHKKVDEAELNDEYKKYFCNIKKIISELNNMGYVEVEAEKDISSNLKKIYDTDNDEIIVNGKIDALFKSDDGTYFILDYKTNKKENTEYRQQLELYRRILADSQNIDKKAIKIGLAYLGLKNTVNNGELNYKLDKKDIESRGMKALNDSIEKLLLYKSNPEEFISKLLEDKNNDNDLLKERLLREIEKPLN